MNNLLASSVDPKQLSLTVKGFLLLIVPLAGMLISYSGHHVDNSSLENIATIVGDAVYAIGGAVSAIALVVGAIRKLNASF